MSSSQVSDSTRLHLIPELLTPRGAQRNNRRLNEATHDLFAGLGLNIRLREHFRPALWKSPQSAMPMDRSGKSTPFPLSWPKMVMIGLKGLRLYNALVVNCSVWRSLRPRLLPRCILLTLLPNMTMIISRHGKLTVKSRKTHSDDPCLVHI